jgi:RNA polymerase sigma-70 factor (ECF subfamily)
LRDREAFGPWVATIARRLALDAARKNSTMKLAGAEGLSRAGELSAESADLDIDSERLMAVVLALPMRERQVVLLRHFDGHDVQTIAQISGESVGTITKRLSRAHARLKEQLEGKNP